MNALVASAVTKAAKLANHALFIWLLKVATSVKAALRRKSPYHICASRAAPERRHTMKPSSLNRGVHDSEANRNEGQGQKGCQLLKTTSERIMI